MNFTELGMAEKRISSLEIAGLTNKLHKDVMRAIRGMEPAWEKVNGRKFALVDYYDQKGEKRPCYSLNKVECLFIATKFNDEARAKIILRWDELEKSVGMVANLSKTQIMAQAVLLANEEIEQLKGVIEDQREKVEFADAVLASKDSIYVAQLANILCQNGYKTGQNRLFDTLREMGYLYKTKKGNRPRQCYVDQGLFEVNVSPWTDPYGEERESLTTMVTTKGQQYFIDKFCNGKAMLDGQVINSNITIINNNK